jgi:hypothetical protein
MDESSAGYFAQNQLWFAWQALGEYGSPFAIKGSSRLEVIRTIENSSHHVPLGEADGVITDGIQHAAVILTLGPGSS